MTCVSATGRLLLTHVYVTRKSVRILLHRYPCLYLSTGLFTSSLNSRITYTCHKHVLYLCPKIHTQLQLSLIILVRWIWRLCTLFWDVRPCILVVVYRSYGGKCYFHFRVEDGRCRDRVTPKPKRLLTKIHSVIPHKNYPPWHQHCVIQGGSNMTGTDLRVNKLHCAAAVRPWESEATTSTLPPARVRTCSVLSGSC